MVTLEETTRWELLQNDTSCFEQIGEATLEKIENVRPLTYCLTDNPSYTVTWFQLLLCMTSNSIKHQSFVYTHLNNQTVL